MPYVLHESKVQNMLFTNRKYCCCCRVLTQFPLKLSCLNFQLCGRVAVPFQSLFRSLTQEHSPIHCFDVSFASVGC